MQRKINYLIISGLLILLIVAGLGIVNFVKTENYASAATATSTIDITATVQSWLTFSANPTSATLSPDLVDSSGNLGIASSSNISLSLGTNADAGWSVTIQGKYGGLCHTSATGSECSTTTENLIASTALTATTTLNTTPPGTDVYGANASSTIAGASVGTYYNYWGTDIVGAIASSSSQTLVSKSSANASSSVALLKVEATSDQAQKSGNYYDTITLTATTVP